MLGSERVYRDHPDPVSYVVQLAHVSNLVCLPYILPSYSAEMTTEGVVLSQILSRDCMRALAMIWKHLCPSACMCLKPRRISSGILSPKQWRNPPEGPIVPLK